MNKIFILLCLAVCSVLQLFGQEGYVFKHITSDNGLSHNTVHSIYQDRYGFMWFGTESGLNKYDGVHFTVYYNNPKDRFSVGFDHVVAIGEDSYDNMWFGSDFFGLSRYNRKQDIFENYLNRADDPKSISNNKIRAIFEDSKKNLWIATTGGGINLYDRKTNSFKRLVNNPKDSNSIGSNYITSIAEDKRGNIWFGSSELTLCMYHPQNGKFTNYKHSIHTYKDLNTDISYKICIDSDEDIWMSSELGLFKFDHLTKTYAHYTTSSTNLRLNSNISTDIIEYSKGVIFVLTDHGGLNIINKYSGEIRYLLKRNNNPNSLSNNQLYSICKTKQGQVWIGTFFGGLNILDQNNIKFQRLQNIVINDNGNSTSNSVLSACEDANGDIWIGCDGQGLQIYNYKTGSLQSFKQYSGGNNSLENKAITEIIRDNESNLWIGTYQWGVYKYDWKTKEIRPFDYGFGTGSGTSERNIRTLAFDNSDNLILGTFAAGLICYNFKNKEFSQYRFGNDGKGLTGDAISKVFVSINQRIWLGLYTGLSFLDVKDKKVINFVNQSNNKYNLVGTVINDIYQDKVGNIWFGTDQGLSIYLPDKKGFQQVLNREQIKAKNIFGILSDKNHNLWLSSDHGILKYNLDSRSIETFGIKDGLQGNVFSLHSKAFDSRGFLYFGGSSGLNIFMPEKIKKNTTPPPIFLTGFKISHDYITNRTRSDVYSEHINFAQEINLSYKENNISFDVVALSYSNPELNQFAYKLEGFDKDWNNIGTKNEITFTNLRHGEYILKVKGSNSDGTWNNLGTSIKIIISPAFWETIWFRILVSSFIMIIFASFYYIRTWQIKAQNKLLEKMVQERTDELASKNKLLELQAETVSETNSLLEEKQLHIEEQAEELLSQRDELYDLNSLKDKLFSIIAHDLRSPFNSLLGLTKLLITRYDQYKNEKKLLTFKMINESLHSIYNLLENLLSWSRAQRGVIDFKPQKTDLVELLKVNIKLCESQMNSKEILLLQNFEKSPYFIMIDADLINTVVRNLLNNAIKFTEKKGSVELGFCSFDNKTKIWVKDNGVGIDSSNIEKLFDKKANFSTIGTNNEKGTGLGLILCKEFIELHKGDIYVESQPGKGSSFYFILPQNVSELN